MPEPPTLQGTRVHLVPLECGHADALEAAGRLDPSTFQYMSDSPLDDGGEAYVEQVIAQAKRGECCPFAIVDASTSQVVGSTRFGDLGSGHPRCEIGWTWLTPSHRGGSVNAELKLLMFEYAFEILECERVAIKTDARNVRAQRAIERVGARREGILRKHMRTRDGYVRDTVYYSVIRSEWPEVRTLLATRLADAADTTPA